MNNKPTSIPRIVGPDGRSIQPPPPPTIGLAVDHKQQVLLLTVNGSVSTAKGLVGVQIRVPLSFAKAHSFAKAIQAAMIPPELEELEPEIESDEAT